MRSDMSAEYSPIFPAFSVDAWSRLVDEHETITRLVWFAFCWRSKYLMRRLLTLLILFTPVAFSAERIWLSDLDGSRWHFDGNESRCELTHQINGFGSVQIIASPDEAISVHVQPKSGSQIEKLVSVESIPPPWHVDVLSTFEYTGEVDVRLDGGVTLKKAQSLYDTLAGGDWLWISVKGQQNQIHSLQVPNVHFPSASEKFNACRANMLPISYASARNTTIHFERDEYQIGLDEMEDLSLIAELLANDKAITRVLVDGYANDAKGSVANLRLAQARAEEVGSVLAEAGVPLAKMEFRWHGDRYLVADDTEKNKQNKNRYVSVRLIKKAVSGKS
ncbi:OmpA family protein [Enterovibrio makurazakiensis]|uniref:OmpA family protein n=1 Tax=Enterovibrio gelatinilyticus TaxID=2899819 RepID=A0ABT5R050_9GAMM|nr:OmpA family protein [Enterovibrio sp. ZSDZ42]MDD1793545.1 OmpA family protein [Enterovibrio sp. ZSDZ42]